MASSSTSVPNWGFQGGYDQMGHQKAHHHGEEHRHRRGQVRSQLEQIPLTDGSRAQRDHSRESSEQVHARHQSHNRGKSNTYEGDAKWRQMGVRNRPAVVQWISAAAGSGHPSVVFTYQCRPCATMLTPAAHGMNRAGREKNTE